MLGLGRFLWSAITLESLLLLVSYFPIGWDKGVILISSNGIAPCGRFADSVPGQTILWRTYPRMTLTLSKVCRVIKKTDINVKSPSIRSERFSTIKNTSKDISRTNQRHRLTAPSSVQSINIPQKKHQDPISDIPKTNQRHKLTAPSSPNPRRIENLTRAVILDPRFYSWIYRKLLCEFFIPATQAGSNIKTSTSNIQTV